MSTSRIHHGLVSLSLTFFIACAPSEPMADDIEEAEDEASAASTSYVEIGDYLTSDADIESWITLRRTLASAFDDICGDTFCEGDYSNLASLDFTCSVTQKKGKLKECAWTFAASDDQVSRADGTVASAVPFFVCRVRPKGKAADLLAALGSDPLHATLPGLDGSLYDALGDCFEEPREPVARPGPTEGAFTDVLERLEGPDIDAWYAMTRALREDFDQVCGDTFCEGDFANWAALRLRCSEDVETLKLGSCAWSFAASDSWAKKKGAIGVTTGEATCTFTVDATATELAAALAPDLAGEPPLMRPLPGSTMTIYDALIDCL
ncbi:MAG: hypothetical protein HOV80_35090 [Polyangiaceae bacterium]|nr:hypothetical protein [Polyangiaceae bacterium]